MSTAGSSQERSLRWSVRDGVIVVMTGVLFGVIYAIAFVPFSVWLYNAVGGNRPLESLINGIWMLGGFVAMALVRKPGALLVGESIAAFVEVVINACPLCAGTGFFDTVQLGSESGRILEKEVLNPIVFSGILQGMGGEMVFCLSRYVRWDLAIWMAAGLGTSLFSWASGIYVTHSYYVYDAATRWWILLSASVGIVVVAGIGCWALSQALFGKETASSPAQTGDVDA